MQSLRSRSFSLEEEKSEMQLLLLCCLNMDAFRDVSSEWGVQAQTARAVGGVGGWRGWWSVELADISVSSSLLAVHGIKWTCSNGNSSSGFSVEQLVQQILDSHQTKPPPRTHNCLCTGTLGKGSRAGQFYFMFLPHVKNAT